MRQQALDFLILTAGIPFLGLAAACYALGREIKPRIHWEWLCAFACMLCLHMWMEVAEIVSGGMRSGVAENVVLLLAYLTMFGFALSHEKLRGRYQALWYIVPVSITCTILLPGGSLAETLITTLVGLPATAMSALAVWLWADGGDKGNRSFGRAFAVLLPTIPLIELILGGSLASQVKAGAHAPLTYTGYFLVGGGLAMLACGLDSVLLRRDWGPAAVRSNVVHLAALLLFLGLVLSAGWLLSGHLSELRYNESRATAQRRDVGLAERINSVCRTGEKLAKALAANNTIKDAVHDATGAHHAAAQQTIVQMKEAFGGLLLVLFDPGGTVIAASEERAGLVGSRRIGREFVRSALAGNATTVVWRGQDTGKRGIVSAVPVRAGDERTGDERIGAVAVVNELEPLEEAFPRDSNTLLVSPEGTIWMTSRPEWLFRQLWGPGLRRTGSTNAIAPASESMTGLDRPLVSGDEITCSSEPYLVNLQDAGPQRWHLASLSPLGEVQRSRGIALLVTGAAAVVLISLTLAMRQRTESFVAHQHRSTLEQNMHQMERLIRVLSHDLRTPLNASKATVDYLLLNDQLEAESREMLTSVGDQQMRMADMVTRMLDAMRIRSGAMEWSWGEVNIRETLESARSTILALPNREPAVGVELKIAGDVTSVRGDAQSIRRLVENLAGNAIRHTKQGKVTIAAERITHERQSWLRIRVQDTGDGMDQATLALLGRPFVLGGRHNGSGSGLGVGICCGICAAHGGRLVVQSRLGGGSTFAAWLRMDLPAPQRPEVEPAVQVLA